MRIRLETSPVEKLAVDALALIGFEPEETKEGTPKTASQPPDPEISAQDGWMTELRASGEFTGKLYEMATLHRPQGSGAKRLVVIGGGKRAKISTAETRRIAGALLRGLKSKGVRTIALLLEGLDTQEYAQSIAEGAVLGSWEADKYKSDPKKNEKHVDEFALVVPKGDAETLTPLIDRGRTIAEAQNLARDLVNEPPNRLLPETLAKAAQNVSAEFGLECDVLDESAMRELGMGALLGVAQGSSNPPFLIAIKYRPSVPSGQDHLALVGKGVTFDTGGISIKPAEGMDKMKYDMAGAAAVIGAMQAIAQLKPAIPVTGYIPTVENMLNGNAQRPGDIVTSLAGKTIEVLNTDAEGRLILADAITYALRHQATHIVDAATLTGAIGIALGHHNMGAFTNRQDFCDRLLAAAKLAGEKTWQMPMDDEYKEYLKSAFADLPNVGGRYGGSITAAWFLREFADPTPWVHLDIASTAWLDDPKAWLSKGPSGVAVRTFIQLALDWRTN
jgi:leucyl aminopeptidase